MSNRRYVVTYLAVLIGCLAGVYGFLGNDGEDLKKSVLNFYALTDDDIVITRGLTRQEEGRLKVRFLESYEPPRVGLFGNHQFWYLDRHAMGAGADRRYFFNFYLANIGLPQIADYLSHLAQVGKLPLDTILVQVTTPNNDNGQNLLTLTQELPPEMVRNSMNSPARTSLGRAGSYIDRLIFWYEYDFSYKLRYSSLLYAMQRGMGETIRDRVVHLPDCASERQTRRVPDSSTMEFVRRFLTNPQEPGRYCSERYWWQSMRNDGSRFDTQFLEKLTLNANPLNERERHLVAGDQKRIAFYLRMIDEIGRRAGRKVVFIVPPVYESVRPSTVDTIFDAALKEVPNLTVFDHRGYRDRKEFFMNYDHPSAAYFRFMAGLLREKHLIPDADRHVPASGGG